MEDESSEMKWLIMLKQTKRLYEELPYNEFHIDVMPGQLRPAD